MERNFKFDNGKYEIILQNHPLEFVFKALRHGEEWRDLAGDKLVLALVNRIEELYEELNTLEKACERRPLMKILVDEMPYFDGDCLLCRHGECGITRDDCLLTNNCGEVCPYLEERKDDTKA